MPETSQSAATEVLLAEVVRLNLPRIKSRLKLRKKHALESSTVAQIAKLWKLDNHGPDTMQKVDELIQLNQDLKKLASSPPTPVASQIASNIARLAYELSHIRHADGVVRKATGQNQVNRCLDSFEKVGQYYRASRQLVAAAKRADVRLFHRIQVRSFQTHIPQAVRKNSLLGSSTAIFQAACTHVGRSELLKRFQGSEKVLDAAIINRLNRTRPAIKVHAEIQLLFFYECNQVKNRPRVIAASKASCYLCDLFLKTHGGFQTISTFGQLNERWILPDWLPGISEVRLQHLQQVVQRFDGLLDALFPSVVVKAKHAVDPIESLIALSATWPSSPMLLDNQTDKLLPVDRRHCEHRLIVPPPLKDRPGQPIGLWHGTLIDLAAVGLPYIWTFNPKIPQLQVKMGQLTLLLDFTGICTGRLAISQDGSDVENIFDATSLPTDSEICVHRSIGFNEISLRIIHGNVFLNLIIS